MFVALDTGKEWISNVMCRYLILSYKVLEKRLFSMYASRLSSLSALLVVSTADFIVKCDHLYPLQFALHWSNRYKYNKWRGYSVWMDD